MTESARMRSNSNPIWIVFSRNLKASSISTEKAIRAILKEYPTAEDIAGVRIDRLKNIASDASQGKFNPSKIERLKEAAKSSVGFYSCAIGLNIQICIETLEQKERQIDVIEKAICSSSDHQGFSTPPITGNQ